MGRGRGVVGGKYSRDNLLGGFSLFASLQW